MLGRVTTPQNLDERFRDAVSALQPPRARRRAPGEPGPRRLRADRGPGPGAVRRPAHQPPPRPRRPLAAQLQRGLLHDRLVRPRGQRGGRRRPAPGRSGPAALPVRRRSTASAAPRPVPPGRRSGQIRWSTPPGTCCAAWWPRPREPIAGGRHKVFGRADLQHRPDHLDRRLAPAPGRRPGVRASGPPGAGTPLARRRHRVASFGDASVNHASATAALNAAGWYDHAASRCRCCWSARTTASASASRRRTAGWPTMLRARPGLRYFAADGVRPGRRLRRRGRGRRVRARGSAGPPCCTCPRSG